MDRVADLIVVSGPPGAGKSTVAQSLVSVVGPRHVVSAHDLPDDIAAAIMTRLHEGLLRSVSS